MNAAEPFLKKNQSCAFSKLAQLDLALAAFFKILPHTDSNESPQLSYQHFVNPVWYYPTVVRVGEGKCRKVDDKASAGLNYGRCTCKA